MKKAISIILLCLLFSKTFAGEHFHLNYINHTQQDTLGWATGINYANITVNYGDSITLFAHEYTFIPFAMYWYLNGVLVDPSGINNNISGVITQPCVYAASGGITSYTFTISVVNPTGIYSPDIKYLPLLKSTNVNTAIDIQLRLPETKKVIMLIFDNSGKLIKQVNYGSLNGDIEKTESVQDIPYGVYHVSVFLDDEKLIGRFVKL